MDERLRNLSIEERLSLVEELWDSIVADQAELPMTDEQRAELDDRIDAFEADGDPGQDAMGVIDEIRRRL